MSLYCKTIKEGVYLVNVLRRYAQMLLSNFPLIFFNTFWAWVVGIGESDITYYPFAYISDMILTFLFSPFFYFTFYQSQLKSCTWDMILFVLKLFSLCVLHRSYALFVQLSLGPCCFTSIFSGKGWLFLTRACSKVFFARSSLMTYPLFVVPQTTFKGRVFMTHATKAIYKLLLSDYVKVSKVSVEDMLYDEQDILRSMDRIEVCLYGYSHHLSVSSFP